MLLTPPSHRTQHLLRQGDLQGTPRSFSPQHRTRASCWSCRTQTQSGKPSVHLPAFLQLSWTLTFLFFPLTSEPLYGCCWARLPCFSFQYPAPPVSLSAARRNRSLTSHFWDSTGKPAHGSVSCPRAKNPQLHPLKDFFLPVPSF